MSRDDIDHIPSIVPSRDNEHTMVRPTPGATRGKPGGSGGGSRPPAKASSGGGMFGKLVAVVALVVAAVACAWAWQLQEQLRQSEYALQGHETRIADFGGSPV